MISITEFSPKALDFLTESNARVNILHGSVRSGKTVDCTLRWLSFLLDGPQGDLFMIGKTTATLQRNVLNDLFDLVGPGNYKWLNKQQGELRLFHRRIYCIGANNEDAESKIRGATIAGALCDEANLYPKSFFNQLMARMSIEGAKCFANCNPDGPFHWFYTDYIMNDDIENKKVWHFTMDDNPGLTEEYKKSLAQMYSGVYYARFIDGLWVAAEGAIYDMFDIQKHVRPNKDVYAECGKKLLNLRYYVGCDYATSSVMSWSLIVEIAPQKFHKLAEYYYDARKEGKQQTDSEFADDFVYWLDCNLPKRVTRCNNKGEPVEYEAVHLTSILCDPSAASWKAELRRRGFPVHNANNDVLNGIRFVAKLLTIGDYTIDDECVNTQREYQGYIWDAKAEETGQDKPVKKHDHACDSDRYVLYTVGKRIVGAFS